MTDAICRAILAYTDAHPGADGLWRTEIPHLALIRGNCATALQHAFYESALIFVAQGAKDVMIGDSRFHYTAGQYLSMSVGLPVLARVTDASDDRPYLALALTIDLRSVNDLIDEIGRAAACAPNSTGLGLFIGSIEARQADALGRIAGLLATPEALRVLYPTIVRELFYWTLVGEDGAAIRRIAAPDSHTQRIATAIAMLRADFTANVSVERLAASAHMSPSSFHQHFKLVTSMSPLQYQKQLRLLEARRLMRASGVDATRAAYEVGYESASQFSREYARMFGAPPRRDVAEFRASAS